MNRFIQGNCRLTKLKTNKTSWFKLFDFHLKNVYLIYRMLPANVTDITEMLIVAFYDKYFIFIVETMFIIFQRMIFYDVFLCNHFGSQNEVNILVHQYLNPIYSLVHTFKMNLDLHSDELEFEIWKNERQTERKKVTLNSSGSALQDRQFSFLF